MTDWHISVNMDVNLVKAALLAKDLGAYSSEQLCVAFAVNLNRALTAIIWVIDDPKVPAREVARKAFNLLVGRVEDLRAEVARYSNELAKQLVVYLKVIETISLELSKRAHPGAISMLRSVGPGPPSSAPAREHVRGETIFRNLLEGFEVERLRDYTDSDPRDLQQVAMIGIVEEYEHQMNQISAMMPADSEFVPIGTSLISTELRGERWEWWRASRSRLVQGMLVQFLPLVSASRFEQIRMAAREAYRREWEKRQAKKRGGIGLAESGRDQVGNGRSLSGEGVRPAQERLTQEDLEEVSTSEIEQDFEDGVVTRLDAARLFREAERRWGKRGRVFLERLAQDATIEEASRAAGVSRQTGQNYLRKLKSSVKAE
jgi:hypothetical protein